MVAYPDPIVPSPTGRASGGHVPGISCLATTIWSLRDKHICVLVLRRMRLREKTERAIAVPTAVKISPERQFFRHRRDHHREYDNRNPLRPG
jgi:hypothetical protein